jgi:hypothetical protein
VTDYVPITKEIVGRKLQRTLSTRPTFIIGKSHFRFARARKARPLIPLTLSAKRHPLEQVAFPLQPTVKDTGLC